MPEPTSSSPLDSRNSPLVRRLADYDNSSFVPGRGFVVRAIWYYVSLLVFESGWFPISGPKRFLLRFFGAKIGRGVVIKPNVRIKYPWRLSVGDHSWLGQDVWIDNLAQVTIGSDVCLSQGVYVCTGSHAHKSALFELITNPIVVEDGAWIAAKSVLLPGAFVRTGVVVAAGEVVRRSPRI